MLGLSPPAYTGLTSFHFNPGPLSDRFGLGSGETAVRTECGADVTMGVPALLAFGGPVFESAAGRVV